MSGLRYCDVARNPLRQRGFCQIARGAFQNSLGRTRQRRINRRAVLRHKNDNGRECRTVVAINEGMVFCQGNPVRHCKRCQIVLAITPFVAWAVEG